MNLSTAMTFPFQRKGGWSKIIIGGVFVLIPVIGWLLIGGYMIEVLRRMAAGEPDLMPEWDDFGTKLKQGALAFGLFLIWFVAVNIIFLPLSLLAAAIDSEGMLAFAVGFFIIGPAVNFVTPAFLGRYAVTDDFMAGLRFREILGMIRRNFGRYFGSWLLAGILMLVAMFILWSLGAVFCGIGYIFTQFYWTLFIVHLRGQLYLILARGGEELAGQGVSAF